MHRRYFLTGVATVAVKRYPAEAQPTAKVARIGCVSVGSDIGPMYAQAFRDGLREFGFTIGENVTMEYRWLGDRLAPAPELVADFTRTNVDLIVAHGTPAALSAKKATTTIPVVMVGPRNPVELGIVTSLARPGGNITGIASTVSPEVAGVRLSVLKEIAPRASRIAHLWSSTFPGTRPYFEETVRAGSTLHLTIHSFDVTRPDDLPGAFAKMKREHIDAISVDAALYPYRKRVIEVIAASRLPAVYGNNIWVGDGGLASYSSDWLAIFRKAGSYAGRILKGAKPADLPVEQPTTFALAINMKTAKALGLTIPPSLLLRADQVIE